MVKISIITICLNDIIGLKRTVDSVLKQDYAFFEHIIVDGGSDDGTAEFIVGMLETHNNVVFVHECDDGRSDAFNKGTKLATGDIVIYLNSGDVFNGTDVLSVAAETWEKHPVDVLGYSVECDTGMIMYANEKTWHTGSFPHQGLFIKRDVFDRVGLYNKYLVNRMDYDLFLRFVQEGCSHYFVDKCIARFDTSGISSMNIRNGMIEGLGLELIYNKEIGEKQAKVISRLYGEISSISGNTESHNKEYEDSVIGQNKRYMILRTLINGIYDGRSFVGFLKSADIKNIAIYGVSDIGLILVKMMRHHSINVKYCIDRDPHKKISGVRVVQPDDILENVDAIIVSNVLYTGEIINVLKQKISCDIYCVEDLIKKMV